MQMIAEKYMKLIEFVAAGLLVSNDQFVTCFTAGCFLTVTRAVDLQHLS